MPTTKKATKKKKVVLKKKKSTPKKVNRSSITGKFVDKATVRANPNTTTTERIK